MWELESTNIEKGFYTKYSQGRLPEGISPELVCEESEWSKNSSAETKSDKDQHILVAHIVASGNTSESNLEKVAQRRSVSCEIRKKTRNIQYCRIFRFKLFILVSILPCMILEVIDGFLVR